MASDAVPDQSGRGLSYYVTANALLKANGAGQYQLGLFDKSLSVVLPGLLTLYCFTFIGYRFFPKHDIDESQIASVKDRAVEIAFMLTGAVLTQLMSNTATYKVSTMKITKLTTYSTHTTQFRNFNFVRVDT